MTLQSGDGIFVYTDGVTEAVNEQDKLFGNDRLVDALNKDPDALPEDIINNVKSAVDSYAGDTPQFDDITMLCLRYRGKE